MPPSPTVRVLLVEDSATDAKLILSLLERPVSADYSACDTKHVMDLETAIRSINESRPDVVLLDLHLPCVQGLDTFLELKPFVDDIPVVVLTGSTNDPDLSRLAIHHGAQDFLGKDSVDGDRLHRAIQFAIERVERRRAEFEIASAGFVQRHILSRGHRPTGAELDFAAKCEPATSVGGDFYDCVILPDQRVAVALGDVAGHGLGPALMMAETRGTLRGVLYNEADPGRALTAANRIISSDCARGAFITLFLAIIDIETETLSFAAAGHEGYVLDESKKPRDRLASKAPPLGILPAQVYETGANVHFAPREALFVCTDGITECYSSKLGDFFGMDRVFDVLRSANGSCAQSLDKLFQVTRDFYDYATDDMTALLVASQPATVNSL